VSPPRLLAGCASFVLLLALTVWHPWARRNLPPIVIPVVAPLSAPNAGGAGAAVAAVELYVHQVNQAGGVDGRQLRVQRIDDKGDATVAQQRARDISGSDALLVIGHMQSATSIAAGPIYRDARLAAIAPAATADGITADNPYYFRAIFDNFDQGAALATYARSILNYDQATIVFSDDDYGRSLAQSFQAAFTDNGGTVRQMLAHDPEPDRAGASVQHLSAALAADPDPGIVLLAIGDKVSARDAIVAARGAGADPHFLVSESVDAESFPLLFRPLPEEQRQPGYFLDGVYAASPLIFDIGDDTAQSFAEAYRQAYGHTPGVLEAKYYDAAHLAVEALRKATPRYGRSNRDADRQRVRDALASFNSPQTAIDMTAGPVFFNARNSVSQSVRVGRYEENRFVAAPAQLELITNRDEVNVPAGLAAGTLVPVEDRFAWKQRVVYVGIDVNQISVIDQAKGTFTGDFYLWFRYSGDDEALDVRILNDAGANFDPKSPFIADEFDGLHHRLYHVHGDFKVEYDFHDFPFDRQILSLQLENQRLPRSELIYAVDEDPAGAPAAADSGGDPTQDLQSWSLQSIRQFQATLHTTSTRGYGAAATSGGASDYSTREVALTVQRRAAVVLVKTLLPLLLLTLVVFSTLYCPPALLKERLTIAISAMLAAAVLLSSINNAINASYTIAAEYAFYVFFALCLFCVLIAIGIERMQEEQHASVARRIILGSKLTYILTVAVLVIVYGLHFGSRFA